MDRHLEELHAAMGSWMNARDRLAQALDKVCPPSTTGYMHADESWSIINVYELDEYSYHETVVVLDPPEHDYRYRQTTVETLEELRQKFQCTHVVGWPFQSHGAAIARIRFYLHWRHDKPEAEQKT